MRCMLLVPGFKSVFYIKIISVSPPLPLLLLFWKWINICCGVHSLQRSPAPSSSKDLINKVCNIHDSSYKSLMIEKKWLRWRSFCFASLLLLIWFEGNTPWIIALIYLKCCIEFMHPPPLSVVALQSPGSPVQSDGQHVPPVHTAHLPPSIPWKYSSQVKSKGLKRRLIWSLMS